MVLQRDSIPPAVCHPSPSLKKYCGWWHAPPGRASHGMASSTVLVTVTAAWVGAGRSWSQWGPVGTSAAALAMPSFPVVPCGFISAEPSPRSLSSLPSPCPSLACGADSSMLRCHPLPLSPGAESFGLFSCMINGEEQEQTHRAVFR